MQTTLRAGAIGHTGRGNFGHRLHLPYQEIERTDMVAVADPDAAGRAQAQSDSGAAQGYADYREMLASESLDLVSVCPRFVDRHEEMLLDCIQAGCSIYCEKPMAADLASADRVIAAADAAGVKIAVAHQGLYLPQIHALRRLLEDGLIGQVLAVHATGKQDRRGGGEDMLVLGTHLFSTMQFLFGEPEWVAARVLAEGHELSAADVREAEEPVGPIAGDDVRSSFSFASGVYGTFVSRANHAGGGKGYGTVIVGETGRLAIGGNSSSLRLSREEAWSPWASDPNWEILDVPTEALAAGNRLAILDLIEAVDEDRQPISSARIARTSLELILGAYEGQITGGRVRLPAVERSHPLERLR
jgi:predicted dehydrogenase